jgi:hypothetical protein
MKKIIPNKIVFSLVQPDELNVEVKITMHGPEIDIASMIFSAMQIDKTVKYLLIKTVVGFCALNKISMSNLEKEFNKTQ